MKGWWYSKLQKVNYFDSQKDIIWVAHALCCALFATPWTVALQAPLSMGILQARILEWVAMPSSRGSSHPRDQTQVSCIAGGFFTIWAPGKPAHALDI